MKTLQYFFFFSHYIFPLKEQNYQEQSIGLLDDKWHVLCLEPRAVNPSVPVLVTGKTVIMTSQLLGTLYRCLEETAINIAKGMTPASWGPREALKESTHDKINALELKMTLFTLEILLRKGRQPLSE